MVKASPSEVSTVRDILATENNFRSLSIKDLLEAREQYHYHLLNKRNVVGTAVGLYLIRHDDPTPEEEARRVKEEREKALRQERPDQKRFLEESSTERMMTQSGARAKKPKEPRTFANSGVRDYSWPCVLVLVDEWVYENRFGLEQGELHPEQLVPKTLYLPDGRMIPVCVVLVEKAEPSAALVPDWHWPASRYAPGMPIVVEAQGQEHRATAGCLVTDGHTRYALTSRHVCGAAGEPVATIASGHTVEIGRASRIHLTRKLFTDVYPEYAGRRTWVNLDVGLIELTDLNDWTSETLGFGATGALADLNAMNITSRLIDAPVVAAGAASGRLEGRIKALFYRYKSVGGFDYVADFLIAPRDLAQEARERARVPDDGRDEKPLAADPTLPKQTQPGDSGAVWHLVVPPEEKEGDANERDPFSGELRPLAIEWGGQVFADGAAQTTFTFALATSLTTVCRELDVELVLEHNTGALPYWGQMGHYSIAAFACSALAGGNLKDFMTENVDRISFSIERLSPGEISEKLKKVRENGGLVPLADVPDIIWKQHISKVTGGRDTQWAGQGRTQGPEHPTHYADIDEAPGPNEKTLRELCLENPAANVTVEFWQRFYDSLGHTQSRERGLLPFRVWQFFDAMEDAAGKGEAAKYLCAAGLLSHYVGDACQPLHGSKLADGYADRPTTITRRDRETGELRQDPSHLGAGVHSTYETKMIDRYSEEIVQGIPQKLAALPALQPITTGQEAAIAIIELMDRTAQTIPPHALVDAYVDAGGKSTVGVQDALWEDFGDRTIQVMADGARVLAAIWAGAWAAGSGNANIGQPGKVAPRELTKLYRRKTFVESLDLDHIGQVLRVASHV